MKRGSGYMREKRKIVISSLWVMSLLLLCWGAYQMWMVLSSQTVEVFGLNGYYAFTRVSYLPFPSLILFAFLLRFLLYGALALLLFGISMLPTRRAYWSIHAAIWLGAGAIWYQISFLNATGVYPTLWPLFTSPMTLWLWIGIAFGCSLLFALLFHFLTRSLSLQSDKRNRDRKRESA